MEKTHAVYSTKTKIVRLIIWLFLAFVAIITIFPVCYVIFGSFKDNKELLAEIINSSDNNGKAIGKTEKAVRDADSTIRKNQEIIFKRIEASETAQIKAYKHIVSFLDAKGKTGLLDDINKVYEREKERKGL